MSVLKRKDIPELIEKIQGGQTGQIYLVFGERFLCREAADALTAALLPNEIQRSNQLHTFDGDTENIKKTLGLLKMYSLFTGRQVIRVTDSKIFLSKGVAKTLWKKAANAAESQDFKEAGRYLRQMLELGGLAADNAASELTDLSAKRWKDSFGFAKPQGKTTWLDKAMESEPGAPAAGSEPLPAGDVADHYITAFETGIPSGNILLLTAETVDKRKRLFKFIKDNGIILDLSVDSGGSSAALREQESVLNELIQKTLDDFEKKMDSGARSMLLERVGFHPVAVVLETEKLALYTGDAPKITAADVDAVIGRTREEALFELTEALTKNQTQKALFVLSRLQENGIHALAIVATLRNHFKKLIIIRSWQNLADPAYTPGMPFPLFQKNYLPELKKDRDEWALFWSGHPYALYMQFQQAEKYRVKTLCDFLTVLLDAEYRLKSSVVPNQLILDSLIFTLLQDKATEAIRHKGTKAQRGGGTEGQN